MIDSPVVPGAALTLTPVLAPATDLDGLAALMRARGYPQTQLDAALDSEVAQAELTGMTNIGRGADRVGGTPTFFVNGRIAEVTAWPALKSKLDQAIKGS